MQMESQNRVLKKEPVFGRFLEKKSFPGKTVDFHLQHVLQILKAIGPEVNLSYQSSLLKHPTRRQNFANTLQPHCAQYLTPRRKGHVSDQIKCSFVS